MGIIYDSQPLGTDFKDSVDSLIRKFSWGGGDSHMRSTRGVPLFRIIFSRKNFKKGMSIFQKKSAKGYNVCKRKFQIGPHSLMTRMTN